MKDLVVLVSGGSRGLGAAVALDLLRRGSKVATFSRKESEEIRNFSKEFGDSFHFQPIDILDTKAVRQFVNSVAKRFGRIDGLVNNAAWGHHALFSLTTVSDIERVVGINLTAQMLLTQQVTKVMLAQTFGSIVNVSSVNAIRGNAGVVAYSAAKAALDGMTRSLAREVGEKGIRVNSIAPGYFESDMVTEIPEKALAKIVRRTPMGRLGKTSDILGSIRFLLSSDSAFITGQTLAIDGGLTC